MITIAWFSFSAPRRWLADMNMGAGCRAWHSVSERDEGNSCLAEIVEQRLPFFAVWMKRHIHGVAVVESQTLVCRGLTQCADRQCATKCVEEKFFDFRCIR